MLICKGQKMSNFIFFIIVALYIYYNKSDEDCKGQKLSVSILVSRLGQIVIVFPVLNCLTFINVRLVLSLLPSIIVIMSMTTQSSSCSLRHKSPIFIFSPRLFKYIISQMEILYRTNYVRSILISDGAWIKASQCGAFDQWHL